MSGNAGKLSSFQANLDGPGFVRATWPKALSFSVPIAFALVAVFEESVKAVLTPVFSIFYDPGFANQLADGVVGTVRISVVSIFVGTPVGLAAAFIFRDVQAVRSRLFRWAAWAVFYLLLSIPVYLMIFKVPDIIVIKSRDYDWLIATSALAFNLAIFVAKITYGGFESIPAQQIESARASGCSGFELVWRFELPALIRVIGRAITVEWATTIKLTSLVGVIGAHDIMNAAKNQVSNTLQASPYIVVVLVYFVCVAPLLIAADHRRHD